MNAEKNILDISWETLFKIGVFIILMYFLYIIRDLIIWFIFALIISILVEPLIRFLEKVRIPRVAGAIFIYSLIVFLLGAFIYFSVPFLVSELQNFSVSLPKRLPVLFDKISPILKPFGFKISENFQEVVSYFKEKISKSGKDIFSSVSSLFGGATALIFTFFVAIFLSLEKNVIDKILRIFTPGRYEDYIINLWERSQRKVTGWFLIRIIGMIFVGSFSLLSFYFLKINYPVTLSLIGGLLDFIPIIGPTLAALIIGGIASLGGLLQGVFALLCYGLAEFLENIIIFPILSKKIIRISPVLVLVGLFIGGKIWGVLGAILAVPLIAILYEVLRDFFQERKDHIFSSGGEY